MTRTLNVRDVQHLAARGIAVEEAERQLALLARGAAYARLVRPCTPGDGIEILDDARIDALHREHVAAAAEGRLVKFVPASGAASRMFRELVSYWKQPRGTEESSAEAAAVRQFVTEWPRLSFADKLRAVLAGRAAEPAHLLDALLGADGLDYAAKPKGLLEFHRYGATSRTAFEEHLVEAADYVRDARRRCRLHFTVSPEHREAFQALYDAAGPRHAAVLGVSFDLGWSVQHPSTDMLAFDAGHRPALDAEGRLILRPGGHGALIENLNALGGDVVFVKNIDNVQPDRIKPIVSRYKRALAGLLVELQRDAFAAVGRLERERTATALPDAVLAGVGRRLHVELNGRPAQRTHEARRAFLLDRLDRPLRVCGVVRNTGEPGGGPFWVRGADGTVAPQIVESAQVDPHDSEQQRIFRAATHFNPVDLVCGLRNAAGRQHDLRRFVDQESAIVTRKSSAGVELTVLERPGLWNGAMAGWNTVFVEVPLETFSPVKSVLDLLRPEHQ